MLDIQESLGFFFNTHINATSKKTVMATRQENINIVVNHCVITKCPLL